MITKFKSISELPNTYGYISLGNFSCGPDIFGVNAYFKASCKIKEKCFDLIIITSGTLLDIQALVLGDLTNIPGDLLVNNEELFKNLKEYIKQDKPVWKNDTKVKYIYDANAKPILS